MQDYLNTLAQAHQQLKDIAIASLQNDQEIDQRVLDAIKALYAHIQSVKQAFGL